ncbi:phosphatidylinositol 3,4,5-trisphosphate 5-phosphatase 2-like [Rhinatrema bivittatum]|uniref:phosphatidylinositol 3,4,5-trisphosphate 5-phosphatase 2-like n=1 Tax=Rhinatrema bivittatum TaxID=194408 RepID=UPI00112C7718|nr:phosphatidylinositol 3,4,5-trisphosphate 5-phosphatase 2-like [Rhinatrema bivittatum]
MSRGMTAVWGQGQVLWHSGSETDMALSSLETLVKVFDYPQSAMCVVRKQGSPSSEPDLEQLILKISTLNSLLSSLEEKALKLLHEALPGSSQNPPTTHTFQVTAGKDQKMLLRVSLETGTLTVIKTGSSSPEEIINQDQISQLIKSQSARNKLRMMYVQGLRKSQTWDFLFQTARKREAFCYLLQLIKIKHANLEEPDLISLYIGAWNMGGAPPPHSVSSWLTAKGLGHSQEESMACIPHDVYVIGTQENSLRDCEWLDFLRNSLKSLVAMDFKEVAVQTLWGIKLAVLVKPEHEHRISHVTTSTVKTGLAHALGNKGAVGVSFLFNGTSLAFVNCHLASGSEKTARRNQSYKDILRSLTLGDKTLSDFDISLRFNHIFWFGDLNYRLEMDVQDILSHVSRKEFETLRAVDQLNQEKEKNKVFLHFSEEEITFPPTCPYEKGTRDSYCWQKVKRTGIKISVPSWCDRVLWRSHPETHVLCTSYGCSDDITSSDHSPVFATFDVGVTSQFVPKKDPSASLQPARIEFESIEVIIKTRNRSQCFIRFHSTCLEEFRQSGGNSSQSSEVAGFLKLVWSREQLPELCPILADMDYLLDQHLLLTVRSLDSCEAYGECCLALRSMIGSTAKQFETFLSHHGEETGSIRGWMRVEIPKEQQRMRECLYEWIKDESIIDAAKEGLTVSRASQQRVRTRPFSDPSSTSSFTNPAYFIFEDISVSQVPSPCLIGPPNSLRICRNQQKKQSDSSVCHGQCGGSFPHISDVIQGPLEEVEVLRSPSKIHVPHKAGHRRPKSAILVRDLAYTKSSEEAPCTSRTSDVEAQFKEGQGPVGSARITDHCLPALYMAECLSELEGSSIQGALAIPEHPKRIGKKRLRQTQSALGVLHGACWKGHRVKEDTQS